MAVSWWAGSPPMSFGLPKKPSVAKENGCFEPRKLARKAEDGTGSVELVFGHNFDKIE